MKLGVLAPPGGQGAADPRRVAEFARTLEGEGCESVWTVEHVVVPGGYDSRYPYDGSGKMPLAGHDDIPDPLHWLTFAAAHTSTLKLGTAMLILPEHQPVVMAKRLATVDVLSGGRLLAGIGVGWLREEYDAVGVSFEKRGKRADEYLGAMKALWTQAPASFHGEFVSFAGIYSFPRPVRAPGVPIVVGGHSAAAARRAARYGDGFYPLGVDMAGLRDLLTLLRDECEAIGRDPAEIELTSRAPGKRETLEELRELGVSRVVIRAGFDDAAQRIADYQKVLAS